MITSHDTDRHTDSLADYLPNGSLFVAKKNQGSNLRSLLYGLGKTIYEAENKLVVVESELDINSAYLLLDEWESMLGIPCSCFSGTGSTDERIRDILIKLSSSVQTAEDFKNLAAVLGIGIQVNSGISFSMFPLTFPLLFFSSEKDARFTMIVDFNITINNVFPLTFPFIFDDKGTAIIRCLFDKIKPANVNIIYREVG